MIVFFIVSRYCKIPSDAPEIQVIFYSEKPLKISCTKELEPNFKESASFLDQTYKPIATEMSKPSINEKPFSYATMTANSNAMDKACSTNLTANSNAIEKSVSFGTMATSSAAEKSFSFGTPRTSEKPFPFFGTMATTSTSEKAVSFGNMTTASSGPTEKPFSFANITRPPSTTTTVAKEVEAEDEPPKVEFTQVVEEGAVYTKR